MKYFNKIFFIILITTLLLNCGGKSTETAEDVTRIAVNASMITNQDIQGVLNFFGNIEGNQAVKVYSTIPNRVTNIYVNIWLKII